MKNLLIFLIIFYMAEISAQEIQKPNFALASHPMQIEKITHNEEATIIELSIKNQSETGYFCANKNISILDNLSDKKYLLDKVEGIPVCPKNYKFSYVGETLNFKLYFLRIDKSVKYIDIIENCNENCFSIKGIILDKSMNQNIDLAYDYYTKGNIDFALTTFKIAVKENTDYPYGLLHFNIIQIYAEKNDYVSAKKWYNKIINSNFIDKQELIIRLKKSNYYNNLINE